MIDYTCPPGRSKKVIKISDGDNFSFTIPDKYVENHKIVHYFQFYFLTFDSYGPRTKCAVSYRLARRSCKKAYFFCNSFDLPNRSGLPSCRRGDKLRVGKTP